MGHASACHALLVMADTVGRDPWSFRIRPDGSLADGQPFYRLDVPENVRSGPVRSGADGLNFDDQGNTYFATKVGIQILRPARPGGGHYPQTLPGRCFECGFWRLRYANALCDGGRQDFRRHLRRKCVSHGRR